MLAFLTLLLVFTAIDAVWLGKIAPKFYKKHIGHIMRNPPDWTAAALFYFGYIAGLFFLALNPADSLREAAVLGGALGVFGYGTYDLTNKATLKGWPWTLVVVDVIWGLILSSSAVAITYSILN